jgi:hypothetical protein
MNVLKLLNAGLLSYGHAKILVNLPHERIQSFVDYTLQQQLSVHQLEHLITQEKKGTIDQELIQEIENKYQLTLSMNQSSVTLKFKNQQEKDTFLRTLMKKN